MKKQNLPDEAMRKNVSAEKTRQYIKTLKKMIDCKTVFTKENQNKEAYNKFYNVLKQEFPKIHEKAKCFIFGEGCFVYLIEGKNATKNIMLMSHHDVVDGDKTWKTDPFCAVEKNGALYGRGTIDTKTPLFGELQALEELLEEGYEFHNINLFIGSSHNEECCGDGMVLATEYFKKEGIRFEVVLDEGGAITTGMIPGVNQKSAMVAVHEKSRHVYKCSARLQEKGHGGFGPATDNVLVRVSRFISEVSDKKIYRGTFYPEVKETFTQHAPFMSFPLKLLFGNFNLFGTLIKAIMLKIPQTNPMLSTSISFTSMKAGNENDPQIRAKEAEATMFLRCIREDDLYLGLEKIKKIAQKYGVEIEEVLRDYCEPTDFKGKPFQILQEVMNENFPDVIVAPFLLTAGTDARHFSGLANHILRFAPIDLNKEQFASIHAANEYINIENVGQCVCFYKDFIKKMNATVF